MLTFNVQECKLCKKRGSIGDPDCDFKKLKLLPDSNNHSLRYILLLSFQEKSQGNSSFSCIKLRETQLS